MQIYFFCKRIHVDKGTCNTRPDGAAARARALLNIQIFKAAQKIRTHTHTPTGCPDLT